MLLVSSFGKIVRLFEVFIIKILIQNNETRFKILECENVAGIIF